MASCVGLSGNANDACVKALQAGSQQSGVQKDVNEYENKQTKKAQSTVVDFLGKDTADVVGGTVWISKAVVEKRASVGLPNFGICSKMSAEVGAKASQLVLKWSF